MLNDYSVNTGKKRGHNSSWLHKNVSVSASESASRVKTAVNIEQKPEISGHR